MIRLLDQLGEVELILEELFVLVMNLMEHPENPVMVAPHIALIDEDGSILVSGCTGSICQHSTAHHIHFLLRILASRPKDVKGHHIAAVATFVALLPLFQLHHDILVAPVPPSAAALILGIPRWLCSRWHRLCAVLHQHGVQSKCPIGQEAHGVAEDLPVTLHLRHRLRSEGFLIPAGHPQVAKPGILQNRNVGFVEDDHGHFALVAGLALLLSPAQGIPQGQEVSRVVRVCWLVQLQVLVQQAQRFRVQPLCHTSPRQS
mmetsp:Transcript_37439/g.89460  ORF Transcript_37439/g.89460 Transcript_37439/m.89460 type:complete len:260 (-) Transcript_37439:124-903(-)